jgi:hypothetical protein
MIGHGFRIFDYGFNIVPTPAKGKFLRNYFILHPRESQNIVCAAPCTAEPCRDLNRPLDDVLEVLVQTLDIRFGIIHDPAKRPPLARRREVLAAGMTEPTSAQDLFKGRHFDQKIIILCVRWYLTFRLELP